MAVNSRVLEYVLNDFGKIVPGLLLLWCLLLCFVVWLDLFLLFLLLLLGGFLYFLFSLLLLFFEIDRFMHRSAQLLLFFLDGKLFHVLKFFRLNFLNWKLIAIGIHFSDSLFLVVLKISDIKQQHHIALWFIDLNQLQSALLKYMYCGSGLTVESHLLSVK